MAIIDRGRLAALGTVGELKGRFAGRVIVEVRVARPVDAMRALDALPEVEKTSLFGTAVHAVLRDRAHGPDAVAGWLRGAGVVVEGCAVVDPSLEDVFLEVADCVGAAA